ncbi:hypothetical protein P658_1244 [Acinetobacter baumannii UH19608]|nr:hypothetical protein P658_1244 [Acinetobacter baumannii UH19608]KMV01893.1 hypothetical protein AB994_0630 [Acinetobacter baumannii]BAP67213.1 hypothetical protein IOMTU433_2435 [Acinetobacter baumannii]
MGGDKVYAYTPSPVGWINPLGLSSKVRPNAYDETVKKVKQ